MGKFLEGMNVYLSGPIDHAEDLGKGWRNEIKPELRKLKMKVFDPCSKPAYLCRHLGLPKGKTELDVINALKKAGRWDEAEKLVRKVMHVDLRTVDIVDLVVAKVDPEIPMCGTIHELVMASIEQKPVMVMCKGGKKRIHGWLLGLIGHKNIYATQKQLIKRLHAINDGRARVDNTRWLIWK